MNLKLKSKGKGSVRAEPVSVKPEITIYTTSTCPFCHMAKEYFHKRKIGFKEVNVGGDYKLAKEMIKVSGQTGVPVIVVGKRVVIGFDRKAIEEALN